MKYPDDDKINELLHFLKAIKSFAEYFAYLTQHHAKWLQGAAIDADAYRASEPIRNTLRWIDKYIIVCRFLDISRYRIDEMVEVHAILKEPVTVVSRKHLSHLLARLTSVFAYVEKDVRTRSSRLACVECVRLDEALVCFENYSYYASVIMAVSAVEARITDLIRKKSPAIYKASFSKATLGQLIQVFEPGKYTDRKYAGIKVLMPEKHRPLVSLLNNYRVFSAHPVGEPITAQIAESILDLSFAFLLDTTTTAYTKQQLKCK